MHLTPEEIMEKEGFSLDDLRENRLGKISSKQKRSSWVFIFIIVAFSIIYITLGYSLVMPASNQRELLPIILNLLVGLAFLGLGIETCLPVLLGRAKCTEGKIERKNVRFIKYREYYLVVNKMRFPVNKKLYDSTEIGDSYKIYYVRSPIFRSIKTLSLENN